MTQPADNVAHLLTARDVIGKHAPAEVATWFTQAVDNYLQQRGTIDAHLGLKGTDSGHPVRIYRMEKRNAHLRAAHAVCDGDGPWAKAKELEKKARVFESTIWPEVRQQDQPNKSWSVLRSEIFLALKYGFGIPAYRQLYDIALQLPPAPNRAADVLSCLSASMKKSKE